MPKVKVSRWKLTRAVVHLEDLVPGFNGVTFMQAFDAFKRAAERRRLSRKLWLERGSNDSEA